MDHIKLFIFRCVVKSVTFREWTRRLYRGPACNSSISSETICVSLILALEVSIAGSSGLTEVVELEERSVGILGRRLKKRVIGGFENG